MHAHAFQRLWKTLRQKQTDARRSDRWADSEEDGVIEQQGKHPQPRTHPNTLHTPAVTPGPKSISASCAPSLHNRHLRNGVGAQTRLEMTEAPSGELVLSGHVFPSLILHADRKTPGQ